MRAGGSALLVPGSGDLRPSNGGRGYCILPFVRTSADQLPVNLRDRGQKSRRWEEKTKFCCQADNAGRPK